MSTLIDKDIKIMTANCTLAAWSDACGHENIGEEVHRTQLRYIRGASLETVFRDYLLLLKKGNTTFKTAKAFTVSVDLVDTVDMAEILATREPNNGTDTNNG